jgi:hypothetical protein
MFKRSKDLSVALVEMSLLEKVLSKERVHLFAKQAQNYMIGYHSLVLQLDEQVTLVTDDSVGNDKKVKMSHALMEKCVKLYKKRSTHHCALDFDSSFIKGVLTKMEDF